MRLYTLGELRLEGSAFKRSRPLLLLAYLTLEGPQERRFLAELFWPTSLNALKNLTTILSRLKKVDETLIEVDNHRLSTHLKCDAIGLLTAFEHKNYTEVIETYTGHFLEGLSDQNLSLELEEWLYKWREVLATKVRLARLENSESLAYKGQFKFAAQEAERAYHQKNAREPDDRDFERLYRLLVAGDNRLAYEVKKEARSYGLALSMSLEDAKQQLRNKKRTHKTRLDTPVKHNLPKQLTPFIGRQKEIGELSKQLHDQNCRLLSIIGPGGTGKTRLALEIAQFLVSERMSSDGVFFTSFVSVPSTNLIASAIGDVFDLTISGQLEPNEQLFSYLATKEMFLILDNLEHLLEGAIMFAELLKRAPGIRLLVTTREPLKLQAEYNYNLSGLSMPSETIKAENADAVMLFLQRAKMQMSSFSINERQREDVIKICQLVEGMPLALELAATWVKVLPLNEIASEISKSLDFLEINNREIPERHRSIKTVIDYSWRLLSQVEQSALRKLAVFRGGFDRLAAEAVVDAKLSVLASLIDKSFLTVSSTGRYRRHPLIIQFSRDKLAEQRSEKEQFEERHSLYFLDFLREHGSKIGTQKNVEVLRIIDVNLENIRTALYWAIKNNRFIEFKESALACSLVFEDRPAEGVALFTEITTMLDAHKREHQVALGYALVLQGRFFRGVKGAGPQASNSIYRGLTLLRPVNEAIGIRLALEALGELLVSNGEIIKAQEAFKEAYALGRTQKAADSLLGEHFAGLTLIAPHVGDFPKSKIFAEQCLVELKALDRQKEYGQLQVMHGKNLAHNGYLSEGLEQMHQALNLGRKYGLKRTLRLALTFGAEVSYRLGFYSQSEALAREGVQLSELDGLKTSQSKGLNYLGRVLIKKGDYLQAASYLREGLDHAWQIQNYHQVLANLLFQAELKFAQGKLEQALQWFSLVASHQASDIQDKADAQQTLEMLKIQLSENDLAIFIERGQALELSVLIPTLLATFDSGT